ncbi:sohB [Symbiodinium microadriaticum]|nr:sohB [Symbiodinium microadriaticum]CAE7946689.1 sohB [Symbiodinium sp. KB8]
MAICDALLAMRADIICLQEFDFVTPGFADLYRSKLGECYHLQMKQRTGLKSEGLAMLFRRESFSDVQVSCQHLEPDFCDRVAMYAWLSHAETGCRILVANTHLTVAHATNGHDIPFCRPRQMEQVLDVMLTAPGVDALLLCADMNSDHLELEPSGPYVAELVNRPVSMAFEKGFHSALHSCNSGIQPSARAISHTCSYAQDGCVDYVFFHSSPHLSLVDAFLHPRELAFDTPWSKAHGWGTGSMVTLSDHRPLVVDFLISSFKRE